MAILPWWPCGEWHPVNLSASWLPGCSPVYLESLFLGDQESMLKSAASLPNSNGWWQSINYHPRSSKIVSRRLKRVEFDCGKSTKDEEVVGQTFQLWDKTLGKASRRLTSSRLGPPRFEGRVKWFSQLPRHGQTGRHFVEGECLDLWCLSKAKRRALARFCCGPS